MARYAVVGAGAAGISAARTLVQAGREVVVFEARDRPGGRAYSDYSLAEHPVELGAEFIHGERVSTWDWIREFGAATNGDAHRYEMWLIAWSAPGSPANALERTRCSSCNGSRGDGRKRGAGATSHTCLTVAGISTRR